MRKLVLLTAILAICACSGEIPSHQAPPSILLIIGDDLWQADHSSADPQAEIGENSRSHFHAMMEAMDTQISKLLDSLAPEVRDNTYVIFVGDNGTDRSSISAPFRPEGAKSSMTWSTTPTGTIIYSPEI